MLLLELGAKRVPVTAGEITIGSDDTAQLTLQGEGVAPQHAIVQGWADGSAAVRPVAGAEVHVNGVRLGADPTPILHGDKVAVGGHEILVVDQKRAGSTQLMSAAELRAAVPSELADATAPAVTAGRLVSLTDGREYQVGEGPVVFGRDAGADIVVAGNDASRRHAEIHARRGGYHLVDTSANGTFINDARLVGERRLVRGDVIRIGADEFRFYANPVAEAAPPAEAAAPDEAAAPAGAAQRLHDTMFGMPAYEPPKPADPGARSASPLASILIRSGDRKGERVQIRVPIANIGRAEYNDVVIADPSISTMHAKLQHRTGVWMLADLGSTNGTFVDGELLSGEIALGPGATIRFGEISVLFEPLHEAVPVAAAGTQVSGRALPAAREGEAAPAEPRSDRPRPERTRARIRVSKPAPSRAPMFMLVGLLVVALALAAFLMLQR